VFLVETLELERLGNRSYLAGRPRSGSTVVADPPHDVARVITAAAAHRRVRIAFVAEARPDDGFEAASEAELTLKTPAH
jgi:hydroxyacylglutathione hydrolase